MTRLLCHWLNSMAVVCNITCPICGSAMTWDGRGYVCTNYKCGMTN